MERGTSTTEGLTIDVINLSYGLYLGSKRSFKKILHEVSFHLRPGSLCALMGPSGSGKRYAAYSMHRVPTIFILTFIFTL